MREFWGCVGKSTGRKLLIVHFGRGGEQVPGRRALRIAAACFGLAGLVQASGQYPRRRRRPPGVHRGQRHRPWPARPFRPADRRSHLWGELRHRPGRLRGHGGQVAGPGHRPRPVRPHPHRRRPLRRRPLPPARPAAQAGAGPLRERPARVPPHLHGPDRDRPRRRSRLGRARDRGPGRVERHGRSRCPASCGSAAARAPPPAASSAARNGRPPPPSRSARSAWPAAPSNCAISAGRSPSTPARPPRATARSRSTRCWWSASRSPPAPTLRRRWPD